MTSTFKTSCININGEFISIFTEEILPKISIGEMILTERIDAQNLRLRERKAGYTADWHVAGDPTLIIIQSGVLRITLQNGDSMDFEAGELFIAKDYLADNITFDKTIHGHQASVVSNETLRVVHIKLSYL